MDHGIPGFSRMSPWARPSPRQTHVLLLEDDVDLRRVVIEFLAGEGFEVSTCDSYSALRQAVHESDAPVVLDDFWGTSHSQLSPQERGEIRELGRQAPTILLTGRAWIADIHADDLNVVCILSKPVDLDEILDQIRRCLNLAAESD